MKKFIIIQRKKQTLQVYLAWVTSLLICFNVQAQNIDDSAAALKFALEGDRIPNAETVKLEYMKATLSSRGKQWKFTFRDLDKQYKVSVNSTGEFKLKKEFEEDENNSEFWSTLPAPSELESDLSYLEKSQAVINKFNSTFKAQDNAIIEYTVCQAPKKDQASKYASGCRDDKARAWWEITIQVKQSEQTFWRRVEFINGQPVILSRASVYGRW